jgi:hypothetical protein
MGFFTQREHAESNKPTDDTEGKIREFAGRGYASRRRAPAHDVPLPERPENYAPRWRPSENDRVDGNAGRLLEKMTADATKQVDRLLVELRAHRERLLSDAARVQRDLVDYARLSQSTMQSTKIIAESLTHWNRTRQAPSIGKAEEHERAPAGAFVQPSEDLAAAQPEAPADPDNASGESCEVFDTPDLSADHAGAETTRATEP